MKCPPWPSAEGPTVLLTAAVSPNVSGEIALRDPRLRLQQYRASIASWSRSTAGHRIRLVVVETTGASPESLLADVPAAEASSIRVLAYTPTAREAQRGKGAVEMAAIRHAVEERGLMAPDETLYKCTGRLTVVNAAEILTPIRKGTVRVRMTADRSWADTRLLGATAQTWSEVVFPNADFMDDSAGRYAERVIAARLAFESTLNGLQLERFPARPLFSGMSGTTGHVYDWRINRIRDVLSRPLETLLQTIAARKQV